MTRIRTQSTVTDRRPVVDRLTERMAQEGLDVLVVQSKENIRYLTGHLIQSQELDMRHRTFLAFLGADGRCSLVASRSEVPEIESSTQGVDVFGYDEFSDDLTDVLRWVIDDTGIGGGRMGIEEDSVTVQVADRLREILADVHGTMRPALHVLDAARAIKTAPEISLMRRAANSAVTAQKALYDTVDATFTERDIASFLVGHLFSAGADGYKTIQVAAGRRSRLANPTPQDIEVGEGQPIKIDLFPVFDGYLSDTGRTFSIGSAEPGLVYQWSQAEDMLAQLGAHIEPGMTGDAVWAYYVRLLASRGLEPAMKFLGHGLGLGLHEAPFIAPGSTELIEPGMVLALEPVTEHDGVGLHIENVYEVSDSGLVNLTEGYGKEYCVVR
ncbi:M24 family metallopeptidase [Georgenia thermotolerans]|uniref:M24 family metallopeptidase n=1 Tax=Georgenia thermotolerans TaxID=527326 RepID=A0A7J5UTS0_9MICO|nr:M24 family metallopeptidase [Georgenia thermotolerans]KAE8765672.1 M24 family metallopeptidase [Georgenia thermotolerans]